MHADACRDIPMDGVVCAIACRCVPLVFLRELLRAANVPVGEKQATVALGECTTL